MPSNDSLTVIGPDTKIKGEMSFDSGARILGRFDGRITSSGEVQIGNGALCEAAIQADRISVEGTVRGDLVADTQLTLHATAAVRGDINAGALVVEAGASFVGLCNVGPNAHELHSDDDLQNHTPIQPKSQPQAQPLQVNQPESQPEPVEHVLAEPILVNPTDIDFKPPWKREPANLDLDHPLPATHDVASDVA